MQYSLLSVEAVSWWLLAAAAVGYLLGSVCFSYPVAKLSGVDITKVGSGNPGATNTLRAVGAKGALIALLGDVIKGAAAVLCGGAIAGKYGMLAAALAVMIGHAFPLFHKFRGGKSVAAGAGAILALDYRIILIGLAVFAAVLIISRFVSAASILASVSLAVSAFAFKHDYAFCTAVFIMASIVVIRHISNIKKIMDGNENKFSFRKKR